MEEEALAQLDIESDTWLNRGRRRLVTLTMQGRGIQNAEILEVGAGNGANIKAISAFGILDAVETSSDAIERLKLYPEIRQLYTSPLPDCQIDKQYDVICALDVLEHIEDDTAAAEWIINHLKPGGLLVATVPAYQWFFSHHDKVNHHFRRYSASRFAKLFQTGVTIHKLSYFNAILLPLAVASRAAWQLSRNLRGGDDKKQSASVQGPLDRIFRSCLFGEARFINAGGFLPFGLTVFCVITKDDS
jgi:SAM-dependent methyltransferase